MSGLGESTFSYSSIAGAYPLVGQWSARSGLSGVLERADPLYITGWAASSGTPLQTSQIDVYDTLNNSTYYVGSTLASMPRNDLNELGGSYAYRGCIGLSYACPPNQVPTWWHGFAFPIPSSLRDGTAHNLSAKIVGTSFSLNRLLKSIVRLSVEDEV